MSIIRVVKTNQFSVISNAVLQDERLSYDAIGIAARLLSLPDGWRIREDYLVDHSRSSRGDVRRAMTELQANGYLHRRRYQTRPGGPMRHDVALYEQPQACNCDNPACRNWHADGYAAPTCEAPTAGFPTVGIPTVGEPAVIDSTEDKELKEMDLDHDLDPSFSLKERATASTATASDSTPPTITVTELTNEPATTTTSTQQAEIDACLLAYYDNGGKPLAATDTDRFTTLVRTYTGAALIRAVSTAAAQAAAKGEAPSVKVNPYYLGGMLSRMEAEGKLDSENQVTPPAAPATRDTRHRKTYADSTPEERRRKYAVPEAYNYEPDQAAPPPPPDGDANRAEVHKITERLLGGPKQYWDVLRDQVDACMDQVGAAAVRDALEYAKATTPGKFDRGALKRLLARVPVMA